MGGASSAVTPEKVYRKYYARRGRPPTGWPDTARYLSAPLTTYGEQATFLDNPVAHNEDRVIICPLPTGHPAGAGYGVFCRQPFRAGEIVAEYTGELSLERRPTSPYVLKHSNHLYIDAAEYGNCTRYINDYSGVSAQPNVKFVRLATTPYRYAGEKFFTRAAALVIRDIAAGEELLVDYGRGYRKRWGIGRPAS
jgi:hypothetical protein